jgi:2,4-diaminopentanoate dehydrogenase
MIAGDRGDRCFRVVLSGVGRVGRDVTRLLCARPGYRVVAAYTRNAVLEGQDIGLLAGVGPLDVVVQADRNTALAQPADILVVATTSFLRDVAGDLRAGVERGLNAMTTAEEASYPWLADARLADELHQLAVEHGVSILGVGLNPGFIFDALLLVASGISWNIDSIRLKRVVDVSQFSATIQRRLGIGYSRAEFEAGVESGSIRGHMGFPQTFSLLCRCLGRTLERVDKEFEPLIAESAYVNERLAVHAGETAGFIQRTRAVVDGASWTAAEFIAHVDPASVGLAAEDSMLVNGYNPIHLVISPGCQPQRGAAAMVANCIPRLVEARAGFLTVADLALPHARSTQGAFHV